MVFTVLEKNGWIFYSELLVYQRVIMDIGKSEFQASYIYIWVVVSNMNFMFHFIYGMSSFPLTNSYFSRWLLHHQPDRLR